jgi:hypothetical protein
MLSDIAVIGYIALDRRSGCERLRVALQPARNRCAFQYNNGIAQQRVAVRFSAKPRSARRAPDFCCVVVTQRQRPARATPHFDAFFPAKAASVS